jgi:hypothetical protein
VFVQILGTYGDQWAKIALAFPLTALQSIVAMTNPAYLVAMLSSKGTLFCPNLGYVFGLGDLQDWGQDWGKKGAAILFVICSALEDFPQTYIALAYLSHVGFSFFPMFSIVWSVYRVLGHGIVLLLKVAKDLDSLAVEQAENPSKRRLGPRDDDENIPAASGPGGEKLTDSIYG